jgi:glutathionylspermidine synthase
MVLEFCKWDPQVQDVSTLAPFPLLLPEPQWRQLARDAESLAAETLLIERRLMERPDLHVHIGLPRRLRQLFRGAQPPQYTPAIARVMRFDFHPTPDGWRISEVNSDVPGGFTESSAFTRLIAQHFPGAYVPGDPAHSWATAIHSHHEPGLPVALLSAPGFMEDHQVIAFLARTLAAAGHRALVCTAHHLRFTHGRAHLDAAWYKGPLAAVVRFHQAEWLSRLPRSVQWQPLFTHGITRVCNPGAATLTESKRLPLLWDQLDVFVPAWRRLLPETRHPRDTPWRTSDEWLIKQSYCNTGDSVAHAGLSTPRKWLAARLDVMLHPRQWIAQRRFQITPLQTPLGPMFPCIGVYTVDGRAAGIYARISSRQIIAYDAIDAAVLIQPQRAPHDLTSKETP